MKLAVLSEEYPPTQSGGAHVRGRFCDILVDKGHEVIVFTPKVEGAELEEHRDGIDVYRPISSTPATVPSHAGLAILFKFIFAVRLTLHALATLRGEDIDGVHSTSHSVHCVGQAISLVYSVPHISFVGYTPSERNDWQYHPKLLLEKINFRFCMGERIFCRTPNTKETIEKYTDAPVRILHGVVNIKKIEEAIERGTSPIEAEERTVQLGFVGRLVPIKDPVSALTVIECLPEPYELTIVGDGPLRSDIEQEISHRELEERVRLVGQVEHADALSIMESLDAIIITSKAEAYPTVAFEAIWLGCEVFATEVGILPYLNEPTIHVQDLDSFPEAIQNIQFKNTNPNTRNAKYTVKMYTEEIVRAFDAKLKISIDTLRSK